MTNARSVYLSTLVVAAAIAVRPADAIAQPKVLVYCPSDFSTGDLKKCDRIAAAASSALGSTTIVDRSSAVDLTTANFATYKVVIVPSIADYARYETLRSNASVKERLLAALTGRVVVWSSRFDEQPGGQDETNVARHRLLQNAIGWAAHRHVLSKGGTGLVVLHDASVTGGDNSQPDPRRYDWLPGIARVGVTVDATAKAYKKITRENTNASVATDLFAGITLTNGALETKQNIAFDGLTGLSGTANVPTFGKYAFPETATSGLAVLAAFDRTDVLRPLAPQVTATPAEITEGATVKLEATITDDTNNGTATSSGIAGAEYRVGEGTWAAMTAANGTHVVELKTLAAGTHTLCVRGSDVAGNVSPTECKSVKVNAKPSNTAPKATAQPSVTTNEDVATEITLSGTDSETSADALTFALSAPNAAPSNGTLTLKDGTTKTYIYKPNANFHGTDSFTFTASDGSLTSDAATVTITVNSVNDAPVAVNDAAGTDEDQAVTIAIADLIKNDTDVDGATDVKGAVLVDSPTAAQGTVALNAAGTGFVYTPAANYNGTVTFTYKAKDAAGELSASAATVTIAVKAVNDAPVAVDAAVTTDEDTPSTETAIGATDVDGDVLSYSVSQPANGSVVLSNGKLVYTPKANYHGPDNFTYTATDPGNLSATAKVTVTVNSVNDAPVAAADQASTAEDTPLTGTTVLANDTDVENQKLTAAIAKNASHGTATLNADGTYVYTPNKDYFGTDSFTYTASDGEAVNGTSAAATVTITVTPVNDAPTAAPGTVATAEDKASAALTLGGADVDDTQLTYTVAQGQGPANGTVTITNGSAVYTPKANFNGTDSFNYTVTDAGGLSATAKVTVSVSAVNDAPSLGTITAPTTPTAVGTSVGVSAPFSDIDLGDATPQNITVSIDWDDNTTTEFKPTSAAPNVTGAHTYTAAGVYTVRMTVTENVTDAVTPKVSQIFEYVVVYDPNGGFVTGGGTFNSPAGAYKAAPDLTGRATFGFTSKYVAGRTEPTGNTEFQFKAGNLHFSSTSYTALVVGGTRAQYWGYGTVNGTTTRRAFRLTAVDNGNTGDTFQIEIYEGGEWVSGQLTGGGQTIYDNAGGTTIVTGNISLKK